MVKEHMDYLSYLGYDINSSYQGSSVASQSTATNTQQVGFHPKIVSKLLQLRS